MFVGFFKKRVCVMTIAQFQKNKLSTLMAFGVFSVLMLAGCASKPTYQGANTQKIIHNSQGVPNRYMVRQGDTVSKIAERYGLDWRAIGRMNNLNQQYVIYAGQWLMLWQEADKKTTAGSTTKTTTSSPTTAKTTPARPVQPTLTSTSSMPNTPSYTPPTATNAPLSVGSAGLMQFRYPVGSSNPVVRRYGTTNINGQTVNSQGMWFSGRAGDAVLASRAGTVIHADGNIDGAMIAIAHTDGFVSNYFYIQNAEVKSGQSVQAGQKIASMRSQANGTALLEFRISRNASYIDPLSVLK